MKNMVIFNKEKLIAIENALLWVNAASGFFGGPAYADKIKFHMDELENTTMCDSIKVDVVYYNQIINHIKELIKKIGKVEIQWFCKSVLDKALNELKNTKVEYVD